MSDSRSPARWLGPLAILAALAAIFAIVSATTGDDQPSGSPQQASTEERRSGEGTKTSTGETKTTSTTPKAERKTYTVKAGDTLAGIAETTGVSIEELQELNPGVDSNSLSIGQELRLAR